MAKKQLNEPIKVVCGYCEKRTNHKVLAKEARRSEDEEYEEWWQENNYFVKCLGCDNVSLFREEYGSESLPDTYTSVFPDPIKKRTPVNGYSELPRQLREIYVETLQSAESKQPILSGIGIRAIIETVCKDRNAKGGNLQKKIDDLVAQHVLTPDGAKLLHKLRVLGNESAHEVKPHDRTVLNLAFDVVDHLLQGVYILPKNAQATLK